MSAKAVFRQLVRDGPSTRPHLGATLGLSRPTMSAAIGELERQGFVELIGAVQGPLGRSAAQYRVGPAAGHVIAVDAGSTHVRVRVSTLDRRLLYGNVRRLDVPQVVMNAVISAAVAGEVAAATAAAGAGWGPLATLGVALPTRVVGPGGDPEETLQDRLFAAFAPPAGVAVVLENNVNCAAVAEGHYGAARDASTFAFVQIGLKIGMGLVLDGRLVRGRNGAAGEIGHLSFPFAPGARPEPVALERFLGTDALMARVRADWPEGSAPPADTAELLARSAAGDRAAAGHVARHAEDVGALVASCISVVDPGLVVLGGGLGGSPLLLPGVRACAARLAYAAEIRSSALGPDATVLGIERLAIEHALRAIIGALA